MVAADSEAVDDLYDIGVLRKALQHYFYSNIRCVDEADSLEQSERIQHELQRVTELDDELRIIENQMKGHL